MLGKRRIYARKPNPLYKKPRLAAPYKRKSSALTTATKLGIEKKAISFTANAVLNTGLSGSLIDFTGRPLNGVKQGDGDSEREGRRITMCGLNIKGLLASSSISGVTVRIAIVMDTQANKTAPQPADVWDDEATVALDICALRNLNNVRRFKILYDKRHTINPSIAFNSSTNVQLHNDAQLPFEINLPLNDVVNFVNNSDIHQSISDTSLNIFMWSTNSGTYNLKTRLRYYG